MPEPNEHRTNGWNAVISLIWAVAFALVAYFGISTWERLRAQDIESSSNQWCETRCAAHGDLHDWCAEHEGEDGPDS